MVLQIHKVNQQEVKLKLLKIFQITIYTCGFLIQNNHNKTTNEDNKMTTIKSVNHHENFVKQIVPSEKQIAKLAEFGYDEEITKLFVNAVNWISVNDNDRKSMKFFKKNQPLVDLGLVETFEEDGNTYMRLTNKAVKVMQGRKNKINVSSEPRQKVKNTKGYVSTGEINETVGNFLKSVGFTVRSIHNEKSRFKARISNKSVTIGLVVYESEIKFTFDGKNKEEKMNTVLSKIPSELVKHSKMSNTFGFILLNQDDLVKLPKDVLEF